jgi:hypothetical protein
VNKPDLILKNEKEYYSSLEIDSFTGMLKDPSFCYKFYWLEAIVNLINQNITETTVGEIIDEMIANAWYSVVEYHIHLSGFVKGDVVDGLERAVLHLQQVSNLTSSASKSDIKEAIRKHSSDIRQEKTQLTYMVPYRALSGFFDKHESKVNWEKRTELIEYIKYFNSSIVKLPYVFGEGTALNRSVVFNPDWIQMINDNTVEILGWIQYEKLRWLQNNNPEAPGLVYKLRPGDNVRKLEKVRNLWNGVLDCVEIRDVYNNNKIDIADFEIDHFVPWSFVMNDELWNLMPMVSSLNSQKSNNLPEWDKFFKGFADNQFKMYELVCERDGIRSLFEKCYKDNLHSIWAQQDLYKAGTKKNEFIEILSKNMRPVYDSAKRQGYSVWKI